MFKRRTTYNPKRCIQHQPVTSKDRGELDDMAKKAIYGGNPEHKKNPGDFKLDPPAAWTPDKELCDRVNIFSQITAQRLLRKGIRKGMISQQVRGAWPQNVWVVTNEGEALEAHLENSDKGSYHGYPMSPDDPFREVVLKRWNEG
jgi:hypothetical protein